MSSSVLAVQSLYRAFSCIIQVGTADHLSKGRCVVRAGAGRDLFLPQCVGRCSLYNVYYYTVSVIG